MSDTPRTDALMDDADPFVLYGSALIVALARQLERELAAAEQEMERLRKDVALDGQAAITVSGPTGCGKSAVMEIIYRALRDAGLHPYSEELAHERRMTLEQPMPSVRVWRLYERNAALRPERTEEVK